MARRLNLYRGMRLLPSFLTAVCAIALPRLAAAAQPPCLAGDTRGLDPEPAALAVDLVCAEARTEAERQGAAASFRVSATRLDRTVFVRLDGRVDGRDVTASLPLTSLDELPTAAPRLAKSVMADRSLAATRRDDDLVDDEASAPKKKPSDGFWTGSFFGGSTLGRAAWVHGAGAGYRREGRDLALVLDVRFAWESRQRNTQTAFAGYSLGGRYLFGTGEISPFVGGGIGYMLLEVTDASEEDVVSAVAPYVEAGVTLGRLSKFRLDLVARTDLPTTKADATSYGNYGGTGAPSPSSPTEGTRYIAPLTVGLTAAF